MKVKYLLLCFAVMWAGSAHSQMNVGRSMLNPSDFKLPPDQNKIHAWWHFIDNHITREGIKKDLEAMKKQGITGATILSINRFDGKYGQETVKFGAQSWYDMFKFALQEAEKLNMEIGVHNCDGWSTSGGPWIKPENSMKLYVWRKTFLTGGKSVSIKLDKPAANSKFYADASVVAYRSLEPNSFNLASPEIVITGKSNTASLVDGTPSSNVSMLIDEPIYINFRTPFTAEVLLMNTHRTHSRSGSRLATSFSIEASQDGISFEKIGEVRDSTLNETVLLPFPQTSAKHFRITLRKIFGAEKEIRIGEMSLLKKGERGLYQPDISAHSAKTIAVSANSMADFFTSKEPLDNDYLIKDKADVIDLTDKMRPDGTLIWDAPKGHWTVIRFGYTTTSKKIHPATKEGEGLEVDKMDTIALNLHFKNFPEKLIQAAGKLKGKTFSYLLVDSWEAYYQNWTAQFAEEFKKRRGYSLVPYIPVLCGEIVESNVRSEAFLHDFRKTIADLIELNYFKHMADLCHRNGLKLHSESIYGGVVSPPLDILKSHSYMDVPMTEFWAPIHAADTPFFYSPKDRMTATLPTHASLLYNKPIIASEAYTGFALYSGSPWDLKLYGDKAFTEGVNQLILHSYVHQPTEKKPGVTLGMYGLEFNRHNTWWPYASSFFNQQARVQYLLQKGKPVCDALVYLGDKLPLVESPERTAILSPGLRYNYCNADVLYNRITVRDDKLLLDNKIPFQFLLINDNVIDLATLKKLEGLVKDGATIIAPKPLQTLSLNNFESDNAELRRLANLMWANIDGALITSHVYGKGKISWGKPLEKFLDEENFVPDLSIIGAKMDNLMYIHKRLENDEIYYIVNKSNNEPIQMEASFRTSGKAPAIWDPLTGKITEQALYITDKEKTTMPLSLRPRQSVFVVFSKAVNKPHYVKLSTQRGEKLFPRGNNLVSAMPTVIFDEANRSVLIAEKGGTYVLNNSQGKQFKMQVRDMEKMTLTQAKGTVLFPEESALEPFAINKFTSFTNSDNPLIKYYSGTAIYTMEVDLPVDYVKKDKIVYLQLDQFGATASIEINGKPVAVIWEPGYKTDITSFIKSGINKLLIKVSNQWRNRLIGDMVNSRGVNNAWTTSPFKEGPTDNVINKNTSLLPSGISSPIKIYCVNIAKVGP